MYLFKTATFVPIFMKNIRQLSNIPPKKLLLIQACIAAGLMDIGGPSVSRTQYQRIMSPLL